RVLRRRAERANVHAIAADGAGNGREIRRGGDDPERGGRGVPRAQEERGGHEKHEREAHHEVLLLRSFRTRERGGRRWRPPPSRSLPRRAHRTQSRASPARESGSIRSARSSSRRRSANGSAATRDRAGRSQPRRRGRSSASRARSEEHTSELQSRENLVCRLLLEKKKR